MPLAEASKPVTGCDAATHNVDPRTGNTRESSGAPACAASSRHMPGMASSPAIQTWAALFLSVIRGIIGCLQLFHALRQQLHRFLVHLMRTTRSLLLQHGCQLRERDVVAGQF